MRNLVGSIFLVVIVLPLCGCDREAHLYNLDTGAMTVLRYTAGKSRGSLSGAFPSGEKLTGEYSTVTNAAVAWGSIYGSVYSASGSAVAVGGRQTGTAILTGDKGSVLDCEYVSGALSGHGTGACRDNHGGKYKLLF